MNYNNTILYDWEHKYKCVKALLKNYRDKHKSMRLLRDKALSDNSRLRAIIQYIESELGVSIAYDRQHGFYTTVGERNASNISVSVSEQASAEPLEKITHTERVYCDVCPNELTESDLSHGFCERCGSAIDLYGLERIETNQQRNYELLQEIRSKK